MRPLPSDVNHFKLMFPSKYIRCEDLRGKEHIVTIESVGEDTLRGVDGEEVDRLVLKYVGHEKLHVMNVTNSGTVAELYGTNDPHMWVGKSIIIYPTKDRGKGGKLVDCIRIKREIPQQNISVPPPQNNYSPGPQGDDYDPDHNYLEDDDVYGG